MIAPPRPLITVIGLVLALAILRPAPAAAQVTLGQLQARVVALEKLVATLQGQIGGLAAETAARQAADATLQTSIDAEAAARSAADTSLQQIIENNAVPENLLDLANYLSIDLDTINNLVGPHVIFTGANVHVRNDSSTQTTNGNPTPFADNGITNGLGNLIVGYNEYGGGPRNGSHNIVLGPLHSYSSFGGFVAGLENRLQAGFASVSGGLNNTAGAPRATVSGGFFNSANGAASTVSGGSSNSTAIPFALVP